MWGTWFGRQSPSKGGTRALENVDFSAQIWPGPIFRPMFRYVLRMPFVGRRLRVSDFFFLGDRFRHIVIFCTTMLSRTRNSPRSTSILRVKSG